MKKAIEVLKKAGVIEKIQKNFNDCKPPVGTPEETILDGIEAIVNIECGLNEQLEDEFIDAMMEDVSSAIRNELNIEFVSEEDFHKHALGKILSTLGIKGNVHVHVHVGRREEQKGQGEE